MTDYAALAVAKLEERLNYTFKAKHLAIQALTLPPEKRPSVSAIMDYQPLEFFGDRVINLCIACGAIGTRFGQKVGLLSQYYEQRNNNAYLATVAYRHGWHDMFLLSYDPPITGFVANGPTKTHADVVEAAFGAIFIDSGYDFLKVLEIFNYSIFYMNDNEFTPQYIYLDVPGDVPYIPLKGGTTTYESLLKKGWEGAEFINSVNPYEDMDGMRWVSVVVREKNSEWAACKREYIPLAHANNHETMLDYVRPKLADMTEMCYHTLRWNYIEEKGGRLPYFLCDYPNEVEEYRENEEGA